MGQLPCMNNNGVNPNLCFIPRIDRVKVWWIMFIEIHANDDPEKTTDFRHFTQIYHSFPDSRLAVLHFGKNN